MASKSLQIVLVVFAGVMALVFVKLMFDMSRSVSEMTSYISVISADVSEMQHDMRVMNQSIQRMEQSIRGLGQTFSPGTQYFPQMSPGGMMQQFVPDRDQRTR